MRKRHWYDYLWVALIISLLLPFYNIRYVWLSLFFMAAPFVVTLLMNNKTYCNNYCGRGQLYQILGGSLKLTRNAKPPRFLRARWFRLAFIAVFAVKFGQMLYNAGDAETFAPVLQQAMIATTVLGLLAMALFKPRSWCVCCPVGTMTQEICRIRNPEERASEV